MFSLSVSLLFIFVASTDSYDFLCRKNFCPPERPYCQDYQCLSKCPSNSYIYQNNCISTCPGNFYADGKVCTSKCPVNKPYTQDGDCVEMCSHGRVSNNGSCVDTCPNDMFLIQKKCESTCPNDHFIMQGSIKNTEYFYRNYRTYPVVMCVDECPNNTAKVHRSCLFKCPDKQVLFNQSCIDTCPVSHSFIMLQMNHMNMIPVCLARCPPNTLVDGKACASHCPSDKFNKNGTCVLNCSDPLPLHCEYSKCSTSKYVNVFYEHGRGSCLSKCPQNHIEYESECVRFCRQTPLKYLLNDSCVQQCPHNLSYGDDNRCVDECPQKTFYYGDTCLNKCPSSLIRVENKCYSNCPSTFPFKYKYEKKVNYWKTETVTSCRKSCPENTVNYNFQCVKQCPVTWFNFNASCLRNCPALYPFSYTNEKGIVSCVDEQPQRTFKMNNSYFNACPNHAKFALNYTCLHSCPVNFPYAHEAFIYQRLQSICVAACPNGTLTLNKSCVSKCPKDFYIFEGRCLKSCPRSVNTTYHISRSYKDHLWETRITQEEAFFCTSMCRKSKTNILAYNTSLCLYKTESKIYLIPNSCNVQYSAPNIERKLVECNIKRMFEFNNSFYQVCPKDYMHSGKYCVHKCSVEYPLLAVKTRMCLQTCTEQLLRYNNQCVEACPTNTRIINSVCKEVTICPHNLPISLHRKEGIYCLHECPPKYFLDEQRCVEKCKAKKVIGNKCTVTCPKSHPFEKKGYLLDDIPECHDVCPGDKLGDMKTAQCIYSYECNSFVFDKKCYEKCPDAMFEYKIDNKKGCEYIYKIKLAVGLCITLSCIVIATFAFCVCIEENTIMENYDKIIQSWFHQNNMGEGHFQTTPIIGSQIEEAYTERMDSISACSEDNTCLLSTDYEMQESWRFNNQTITVQTM